MAKIVVKSERCKSCERGSRPVLFLLLSDTLQDEGEAPCWAFSH